MNLESARDVLIRHSKSAKNGIFPANTDRVGRLLNPICGDQVEFRIRVEEDCIQSIGFSTRACAICSASASILSEAVAGLRTNDVLDLRSEFEDAVSGSEDAPWPHKLTAFVSFSHLRVNPRRRACAVLPWLALAKALHE